MPPAVSQSRHKIDLEQPEFSQMRRAAAVERGSIDAKARTVELSFASEQAVDRWFGREVLDITNDACDLSRLNNGGAVLVNHDWADQVGVVVKAWVDKATKKARCIVKFSRSQRGDEIFQDITDGIRSLVSVGYIVRKMVLQSVEGELETHRVIDWQPFEVSLVAVPADPSVGVGRTQSPLLAKSAATSAAIQSVRTMSLSTDSITEIQAARDQLISRHPQHQAALQRASDDCIRSGETPQDFNARALQILSTRSALVPMRQDAAAGTIGLSRKDRERFSLLRAINAIVDNKVLDGLERECNDELIRKLGRSPKGFFIPDEIVADRREIYRRTLTAGVPADGGYTVASDVLANEMTELLRNEAQVIGLGARVISGLVGDVSIPRQITGATAYWVSETGSIGQSNATFGQIVGKPRRLGTSVPYSKQFLAQSSLDAESFVVNDSDRSIAVELDRVAVNGAGGAEPLGILKLDSTVRSTSVTFGGAATFAKLVEFEANVGGNNALSGRPAFLTTWASKAKWKTIQRFTNAGVGLWASDDDVAGYRGRATAQFPSTPTANQAIFGDWSQVLYLEWAGRDVVVDPYSGKKEGTVEVTIQRLVDMVVRQGKAFAISSDSGAQ